MFGSPPARQNRFLVQINPGLGLIAKIGLSSPSFITMNTSMPAYQFEAAEINQGKPLPRRIINGITPQTTNFNFLVTEDFKIKEYFDAWQNVIFFNDNTGNKFKYIGFYDDYIADVIIQQTSFSDPMQTIHQVVLHEAYPISVGPMTLDSASGSPVLLPVTMNWYDFDVIPNE